MAGSAPCGVLTTVLMTTGQMLSWMEDAQRLRSQAGDRADAITHNGGYQLRSIYNVVVGAYC